MGGGIFMNYVFGGVVYYFWLSFFECSFGFFWVICNNCFFYFVYKGMYLRLLWFVYVGLVGYFVDCFFCRFGIGYMKGLFFLLVDVLNDL